MRPRLGEKSRLFLLIPAILLVMGFLDWDHFFPLAAQSNLRFQIIGELLELVVLVSTAQLMSFGIVQGRKSLDGWRRLIFPVLISASFSLYLLTLGWRDFFPHDQFSLAEIRNRHLVGVLVAGLIFSLLGFSSESLRGKPRIENEKSVV